ncbi:hypothetical protein A11S_1804 [Micavibrio aeruginosavorus EPB]|uniref:Uncharacterized protein n=1 Tax=Micavibrio aeruginosavorus EPB TaxID=349215 RepID=M4VKI6_9BACT|nr:hypothetical protein A11S_1804 [Micavibrio aeruginosavorus EPB]
MLHSYIDHFERTSVDAVELTTRDSMGDDSPLKEPSRRRSAGKP